MKKFKIKHTLFIVAFLFSLLFNSVFAYAQGDGTAFSSGVKPLNYDYCALEDGTKIQSGQEINNLQPKFTLKFDKNVVNMLVWENNRKCISMTTDNNENVVIDVSKIDSTVDFDHRQEIFLQPINPLQQGKTYYIKVGPELLAANKTSTLGGSTGGNGISISFKTEKQEVSQNSNTTDINQNDTSEVSNNTAATKEQPKTENSNSTQLSAGSNDNYSNLLLDIIIGVFILSWIVFEFVVKRRRKKERKEQ